MPYITMRNNLKLHLSTGLVSSYNIQPGNEVGLFWGTHTYLLIFTFPGPTRGATVCESCSDYIHIAAALLHVLCVCGDILT